MKYGIFGGSFNPIHNGHIIIIQLALEYLNLDKLFVVPAYKPPHKSSENLAPFEKRYEWVSKCLEGIQKIDLSDFERKKGGLSYTIDTVEHFIEKTGEKPYLLIGEDMAEMFHKWHRYQEILEKATVCVYPRYHFPSEMKLEGGLVALNLPLIQISSSDIRKRLKEGRSVRGFVPDIIIEELLEVYSKE
ncbi:MAG: nicotinate-nucleotide adenylyltransferase [Thermotogaceae bacterium]|jgi:nicotinate-nucleotide adenylyltransferase|nr:nicotinate-nucleotide adenylyltransferase [Thermotogaceae bacterium]MDN5337156.1 nicotinate-nucleotide adenylyltransferase [Thermotogaceae bacterium]